MTPSVICYAQKDKQKSRALCEAFAEGCGGRVVYGAKELLPGDVCLYGAHNETVPIYHEARARGRRIFYIDNGYFQPGLYFRITVDREQIAGYGTPDYERLKRLEVTIQPWQDNPNGHVLVILQSRKFFEWRGENRSVWLQYVLEKLSSTSREARIREKPNIKRQAKPFEADLRGAWGLVARSSNTAVEAICAGIPAFVTHECAALRCAEWDLGKIEEPYRPNDRVEWAAVLAANQWTVDEMRDGTAWKALSSR